MNCPAIDADWVPKSYNLDSPVIDGRHTGANLAEAMDSVIKEWDVSAFCCTHDTTSNMNAALRMSQSVKYDFGCLAHILQLAITDTFKANNGVIHKLIKK